MSSSPATRKHSAFTQWCRGLIQMLSYEGILSITVYLPPMFFMVGPASVVANNPWITLVLNAPACETYADSIRVGAGGHRRDRGFQRGRGKAILSCRRCVRGSVQRNLLCRGSRPVFSPSLSGEALDQEILFCIASVASDCRSSEQVSPWRWSPMKPARTGGRSCQGLSAIPHTIPPLHCG